MARVVKKLISFLLNAMIRSSPAYSRKKVVFVENQLQVQITKEIEDHLVSHLFYSEKFS